MTDVQQPPAETPAEAWGQPISPERQVVLRKILDDWNAPDADHGERKGPFDDVPLTGADAFWLAEQSGHEPLVGVVGVPNLHLEGANLERAHLEGAHLEKTHLEGALLLFAHLEGAYLRSAHLKGADLRWVHLERAYLIQAHLADAYLNGARLEDANLSEARLEDANLSGAHLERANLNHAHLEGADLQRVHLEGAELYEAHLEGAKLFGVHLAGAKLFGVHLEGAELHGAHLEGASFYMAHLEGADLSTAWLDSKTELSEATLDPKTRLGDIQWGGVGTVNLTRLNWHQVPILGDERDVGVRSSAKDHEVVVRAYRQLAAQLRAQGMSEVADRFAARAQVRQRKLLFRQMLEDWRRPWRVPGDLLRWLFSWFLALLAGYGFHPGRSVFWYLATIAGFAFMYMQATHGWVPFGLPAPSQLAPLPWYEALILSVSSFHGRGFFQPLESLGDPIAALAAIEAVIGLLIEISFIATFTQRFFGNR